MKNILVTGGSGTIGSAIIKKLLEQGYKAWNLDIKEPSAKNGTFIKGDVTKYDELKELMAKTFLTNPLDGIVTVAGGGLPEEWNTFGATTISAIRESIDLNLMGHINTVHAALPYMGKEPSDKTVTMISSINGMVAYSMAGYSASKAGLEGFMYGISKELGKQGIRVNTISPGTVVTELTLSEEKKDWSKLKEETMTGNFTTPEDVAGLVAAIIENKSICSQNIAIDAGQTVKR